MQGAADLDGMETRGESSFVARCGCVEDLVVVWLVIGVAGEPGGVYEALHHDRAGNSGLGFSGCGDSRQTSVVAASPVHGESAAQPSGVSSSVPSESVFVASGPVVVKTRWTWQRCGRFGGVDLCQPGR